MYLASVGAAAGRKFLEVLFDNNFAGNFAGLVKDQIIDQSVHRQGNHHAFKDADFENKQPGGSGKY